MFVLFHHFHPLDHHFLLFTNCINFINKIIAGATFLACSNKSLTLLAPTPTNISINAEPETDKTQHQLPATAFAKSVLPVPGGPTNNTLLEFEHQVLHIISGDFKNQQLL